MRDVALIAVDRFGHDPERRIDDSARRFGIEVFDLAHTLAAGLLALPEAARATTISFLDSTESIKVEFDGKAVGPPDVTFFREAAVTRVFTSVPSFVTTGIFGAVLTETGMVNSFSDVIVADISGTFFGLRFSFFTFASGGALLSPTEKGFVAAFLGNPALVTPEDGTLQTITFRDLTGAVESLPFNLTVKAISDKETPEPSAWLLFATGAVVWLGACGRARVRMPCRLHY